MAKAREKSLVPASPRGTFSVRLERANRGIQRTGAGARRGTQPRRPADQAQTESRSSTDEIPNRRSDRNVYGAPGGTGAQRPRAGNAPLHNDAESVCKRPPSTSPAERNAAKKAETWDARAGSRVSDVATRIDYRPSA